LVSDDGVGGADPARGSGLLGLKDRIEATGGTMTVHSHSGEGTRLVVELPVGADLPGPNGLALLATLPGAGCEIQIIK
jgi:glucose-6-phosphate-specific signal transduction histidine kinase